MSERNYQHFKECTHIHTHTYKSENNEDYFQNKLNNTNNIMPSTIFNGFPPLHSFEPGAAVYPSRHLSQIAVVPPTEKVFSRHSSHLAAILSFLGIKIKPGLQLVQISSTQVHISLGHSAEQNATRLKTMQRSRNLFIFFNCVV